jgi:hypothetical protein
MGNAVIADVPETLDPETQIVLLWRRDQFGRLGFDPIEARLLSESPADLGEARRVRSAGCPIDLAFQILL